MKAEKLCARTGSHLLSSDAMIYTESQLVKLRRGLRTMASVSIKREMFTADFEDPHNDRNQFDEIARFEDPK